MRVRLLRCEPFSPRIEALEYDDISSRARFVAEVRAPAGVGCVADSVSLEKFAVMSENTFSVSSR